MATLSVIIGDPDVAGEDTDEAMTKGLREMGSVGILLVCRACARCLPAGASLYRHADSAAQSGDEHVSPDDYARQDPLV